MLRRTFTLAGLAATLPATSQAAAADGTLRLIVPSAPGTGVDILSRYFAQQIAKPLDAKVIVDNRAGAGGMLACDVLAKAPADGGACMLTSGSIYTFPWLYNKLPYDGVNDLAPVVNVGLSQLLLLVPTQSPYRTVQELVADAKRGTPLSFASAGAGTASHLAGALFNQMAGVNLTHIPYKVASQSVVDVASGVVGVGFQGPAGVLPLLKAGKVRILAVTGLQRSSLMPEIPTLDESGVKGYELVSPIVMVTRAGNPPAFVKALGDATLAAASTPEYKQLCSTIGLDVHLQSQAQTQAATAGEFAKWRRIVALGGAKLD
ncbi:Bug family tripartite tricarboxylate transporter substrate binding protein [Ramlibacter sp.]|uniref:Bug family tripartite tricarboxylate transporter substrate binding protein n=1 Tax=Ramlibacter sp. TaxID=1917967 RepID=UPI003D14B636